MTAGAGASPVRPEDAEPTYGVTMGLGGVQWLYEVDGDEQVGIGPVGSILEELAAARAENDRLKVSLRVQDATVRALSGGRTEASG